jgi:hypothetical protein
MMGYHLLNCYRESSLQSSPSEFVISQNDSIIFVERRRENSTSYIIKY